MALKPISIRTLGNLVEYDMGIVARCEACGHRRALNMDDLITRLGADFVYVNSDLDKWLRCTECDEKKASAQVFVIRTAEGKSRIADDK